MRFIDRTGERFGRLLVVRRAECAGRVRWECLCDCGATAIVLAESLQSGRTVSCGCFMMERHKASDNKNSTHRLSNTPTWVSWSSMKMRCTWPKFRGFHRYGGRGIQVCDRWANSFENFLADMGERPPGTTLDRFPNNDGNYEPGNCRWATHKEQSLNRSYVKLNYEKAAEIRARRAAGAPYKQLAADYGVAVGTIEGVVRGKSWI